MSDVELYFWIKFNVSNWNTSRYVEMTKLTLFVFVIGFCLCTGQSRGVHRLKSSNGFWTPEHVLERNYPFQGMNNGMVVVHKQALICILDFTIRYRVGWINIASSHHHVAKSHWTHSTFVLSCYENIFVHLLKWIFRMRKYYNRFENKHDLFDLCITFIFSLIIICDDVYVM